MTTAWIGRRHARQTPLSAAVQAKLVDTVFEQNSSVVIGSLNTIGLGIACFMRSGERWLMVWVVFTIVTLAARLRLAHAYHHRRRDDEPGVWANRFSIGALMMALGWGLASAASLLYLDAVLQMAIVSGYSAYSAASIVRNHAVFKAIIIQLLPQCLTVAIFISMPDVFYRFFGILMLLYVIGMLQIARFLAKKTLELLVAKEQAAKALDELKDANLRLEHLSTTDGLTGVVNRRGFDVSFDVECLTATRNHEALSLLIVDIDHFKRLNDAQGHQAGDDCLRRVGGCLKGSIGHPRHFVARYGGEEFAIVLPATDRSGAVAIAEELRRAVEDLGMPHAASPFSVVTVSIGHVTSRSGLPVDGAVMIKLADEALYRAKKSGRNRIAGAADAASPPPGKDGGASNTRRRHVAEGAGAPGFAPSHP